MRLYKYLVTSMILLLICISFGDLKTEASSDNTLGVPDLLLKGAVSENELIDSLERLGIKCILQQVSANGANNILAVDKVHLGSAAYYGGLSKGDLIKNLYKLDSNTFVLVIERTGKNYRLNLRTLGARIASSSNSTINNDCLKIGLTKQKLNTVIDKNKSALGTGREQIVVKENLAKDKLTQKLLPYDIKLIIDISGSMNEVDGTANLTKFQWCQEQISNLARQLSAYNKNIAITLFNADYQIIEGCTPAKLEQIFNKIQPRGGTDLVDPLLANLNNALVKYQERQPSLIVVITDGLPNIPNDPRVINQAVIDFTQKLNKSDAILVTILQIGDTFEGGDFCIDLDDNLVNEGGKYDIVDTKTFAEFKQQGLVQAMINAIKEAGNEQKISQKEKRFRRFMNTLPSSSNPTLSNIDKELHEEQSQRKEIERQLLQ